MLAAQSSKGRAGLATCMNMSNAKNGQECVIRRFFILAVCLFTPVTSFFRGMSLSPPIETCSIDIMGQQ